MKVIPFTIPVAADNSIHVQEDRLPHFYPHLHRHIETQITLIIRGEGTLIAGSSMQPFKNGDLFIIGANQPHLFKSTPAYFKKSKNPGIHSLNIFFDPAGIIAPVLSFPEFRTIRIFLEKTKLGKQALHRDQKRLGELLFKINSSGKGFRMATFLELLQVMSDIRKWKTLSSETARTLFTEIDGRRMNDVYQYTIAHYTEPITIKNIASVAHLTPQSFCRYFKKHTSKTFIRFLNEIRIHEACRLLVDMKFRSVSDLAFQTGFNSVVSFNRVFKTVQKKSPRQFLQDYQANLEI